MNDLNEEDKTLDAPPGNLFSHYKRALRGFSVGALEDAVESSAPDLSKSGINERLKYTGAELKRIIKNYLGDDPALHEIAGHIVKTADKSLRILRDEDEHALNEDREAMVSALETIVRTDGSRPSFMIRNGEPDRRTSPVGIWGDTLDASGDLLKKAISCTGRINNPFHAGTGFLIQENLILTNRHVLQEVAEPDASGKYVFTDDATIDFGYEFRARDSINRRRLKRLIFCGSRKIVGNAIDHQKLDLALIELEPATAETKPLTILSVDEAPDWADRGTRIFTIGYPAKPRLGAFTPTLLEQLFKSTFGCKRLAPGEITAKQQNLWDWTTPHDATTLGGNSGSVVLVAGREFAAAGLHYGGSTGNPRENWGHILGKTLDERASAADGLDENKTLREILIENGVQLIDRFNFTPTN